jgi:signal peptidase I
MPPAAAKLPAGAGAGETSGTPARKTEEKPLPESEAAKRPWWSSAIEIVVIVAAAFALALVIQAFVVKPYEIPTPSMVPTIMEGDRVMTNRFVYRFTEPKRGDIIVFQTTLRKEPLVKRIVAVGGDRVAVHGGKLYLNGQPQTEPELKDQFIQGNFQEITVPAGQYFVMGDNRNDSGDSRKFGPIKRNVILGKAFLLYWPLNRIHWF